MTRKNVWLTAFAVLAIGAAAMLLLERDPGADLDPDAEAAFAAHAGDEERGPAASLAGDSMERALGRTELTVGAENTADDDDDLPREAIVVSGRVVTEGGSPVGDARVLVTHRLSFDAARPGDFGGERGRAFRPRPLAAATTTAADGTFRVEGRALTNSTLDVQVVHRDFAPAQVQRQWQTRSGALQLGDIVVAIGATVSGFVVDAGGTGIAGAEVRVQHDDRGAPMPFTGRGGRGRRGGGEEPEDDPLTRRATTDATGFFRIEHVPEGRFRVVARARRYLAAATDPLEARSAAAVDAGKLQLVLGAELRGRVVDRDGNPVAEARVEASPAPRGERGGRGNRGRGGNDQGAAEAGAGAPDWRTLAALWRAGGGESRTRTDRRGEFVLESLPPMPLNLRVEHPRYITYEQEGIDPTTTQQVHVRLEPALTISGRVLDADSGEPIVLYAIAPREYDAPPAVFDGGGERGRGRRGGTDGEGRRRGRQGANGENQDAEAAARVAAEQARRAQRTAYLQDRLGPTGQTPRNAGRPSKHAEGRFTLTGIQPGRYVLDVSCPQHVSTVFGPIEVAAGQNATDVTILVRRGAVIAGSVEDKVTRKPLQGVVVSLLLPDLDTGTQAAPTPAANLFNVFRREFNRVRVARVRTDAQGRFELPPQRPGDYWLELEHDGYNALLDRAVFVRDGRRIDLPAYALVPGSEVSGRVLHGVPGTQYTVTYWSTEGQRFTARTDENHEYRIEGIEPGSYYVVLSDGSGEPGFGRRGRGGPGGFGGFGALGVRVAEFLGGNTTPDVVVAEGAKVRFDIDARAQTPATVRGKVLVNGSPAAGYEVALDARTEGGANGTPGLGRFARAVMNGRTDEQGQFTISNVVPGSYTLEVRRAGGGPGGGPGGRGRGGGPGVVLHREPIVVAQGATIERTLTFATGALTLAVTNEADGKPVERGNVVLALRSEATGVAPDQWRTLPSFTMTPIRNGTATFRELKLGDWLYRVQSQGLAPVEGGVFVGGGTGEGATLKVALKPPAPAGTDGK